jgi:serine/threonine-protein kinase HSL1, negative regulator of Swe1 kinase
LFKIMAEISASSTRPPLAEATNRINASVSVDQQGQKARLEAATTASEPEAHHGTPVARVNNTSTRPEVRVTPSASALYTAASPTLKPPQEDAEAKRMSQASYESASSSRSRKPYKTHIGPWQLGKTLGKGSSARVRLCRHNLTQQLAAVKIVNRGMAYMVQDSSLAALNQWDQAAPKKTPGEMRVPMAIEREVAILKLIEHPHIMKIYDIWENRSEM